MGTVKHVCLCLLVQVVATYCIDDIDSIVIDLAGAESKAESIFKRESKQFLLQPVFGYPFINYAPSITQHGGPSFLASTGSCYTSRGEPGSCVTFRNCYQFSKFPNVANLDAWVLGMYDTCSYYTDQGRQLFGVCCVGPVESSGDTSTPSTQPAIEEGSNQETSNSSSSSANAMPGSAKIPNWPPPLPTHPPDHTIPPLPTHPPNPAIGQAPTNQPSLIITTKGTTKKPSKPVTTKATTSKPSYDIGTAACGAKNGFQDQGKIVGGHNADLNEWPWIAALFNSGRQFCGGSLIDNIHILSAAHCVAHMSSWDVARVTVRLGDYNIKTNSEVKHVEKRVKRVVRHRGFDSRTLYNDIAILTLDSPVDFSSVIRPVCLPSAGGRDWAGSTGTVIGWGSIRESGPQPAVLQEVNIPIWSNNDCRQKYGHAAPGGIVDHMLCAGQANRDSCSGDSGGPLMVNSGKWTQVGIVSWGIGCGKGQYPGVYTRVEKFLPWITKNLKQ